MGLVVMEFAREIVGFVGTVMGGFVGTFWTSARGLRSLRWASIVIAVDHWKDTGLIC